LFNDLQRQAVRDAARIAGLNVLGLLSESSAAVLGSGIFPMRRGQERKVLAYHLGGGSCEVAAVVVGATSVEVAGVGGDAFLGGEDFDQRIVALICEEIMRSDGGNPRADPHHDRAFLARLRDAAEQAKIQLSTVPAVDVHVPLPGEPDNVVRLDRARLETLVQDLIDRTVWSCEAALREAKWSVADIETVLLSGGQARMPRVRDQLTEVCGRAPFDVPSSEAMVALGAAQQAATLAGAGRRRLRARGRSILTERTGLSLGIESAGGVFTTLIPRGTPLPASWIQAVSTSVDGQTQIVIHLLQGEREMAADNESVAQVQIGALPALPRGEVQLQVEISSDGGGLPTAKALWADGTEVKQVRVRPSAGLNENEIAALAAVRTGRAADGAPALAPTHDDEGLVGDAGGDVTAIDVIDPTLQGG